MDERAACFEAEHFGGYLSGRRNFLRLELCLRRPDLPAFEASPDPFARVASFSRLGDLFLARLRSCDGTLDRTVTLKVLGDPKPRRAGGAPDPNPLDNRLFLEEYRSLRLLKEGDRDPILRLAPFDLKTEGGVELSRLPPLTFCKRRRLFFNPRCPRCGQVLRDCQDDDVLLRFGLRPYSTSSARYVCCPSCVRDGEGFLGGAKRFFTRTPDDADRALGMVGDELDLVGAFGELVARGPSGITEFPCTQCPSASTCYPEDPRKGPEAPRLLVSFSFHDFCAFVHEFLPWRFDEACDLVGGRAWEETALPPEQLQAGRELSARPLRLFFEDDPTGRRGMEIFLVKLGLAGELCRGVLALHRRFGTPHLNLRPEAIWVGLGAGGPGVPGFWDLRVRVSPPDYPLPVAAPAEWDDAPRPAFRTPEAPLSAYAPPLGGQARAVDTGFDLFGVGVLLLRAFVGNRYQDSERLSQVVGGALAGVSRPDAASLLAALPPALWDASQVVYEPRAGWSDRLPSALWRRALLVPLGLVAAAGDRTAGSGALERAAAELERVREEVQRALFSESPGVEAEIGAVLEELIEDPEWLASVEAGRAPGRDIGIERGGAPRQPSAPKPEPPAPPPAEPPARPEPDFEATVILGRTGASGGEAAPRRREAPAPSAPPAPPEEEFEATVILGRGSRAAPASVPPTGDRTVPSPEEDSELDETVILGSGTPRPKGSGER